MENVVLRYTKVYRFYETLASYIIKELNLKADTLNFISFNFALRNVSTNSDNFIMSQLTL